MPTPLDRTYYACPCSARDEQMGTGQLDRITCWACGQDTATAWVPPGVMQRAAAAEPQRLAA